MIQLNIWTILLVVLSGILTGWVIATIIDKTVGKQTKINLIEGWLKYMVILAERKFGSGTGKLKLTYVYNKFVEKWPEIAAWMNETQFNDLVQKAIEKMEELRRNEAINNFINNFGLTELEEENED